MKNHMSVCCNMEGYLNGNKRTMNSQGDLVILEETGLTYKIGVAREESCALYRILILRDFGLKKILWILEVLSTPKWQ